jgi:hypothetical protein
MLNECSGVEWNLLGCTLVEQNRMRWDEMLLEEMWLQCWLKAYEWIAVCMTENYQYFSAVGSIERWIGIQGFTCGANFWFCIWIWVWIPILFNLWIPTMGQFRIPIGVLLFGSTSGGILGFRLWCNLRIPHLVQSQDSASGAISGFRLWCNLRIPPLCNLRIPLLVQS